MLDTGQLSIEVLSGLRFPLWSMEQEMNQEVPSVACWLRGPGFPGIEMTQARPAIALMTEKRSKMVQGKVHRVRLS